MFVVLGNVFAFNHARYRAKNPRPSFGQLEFLLLSLDFFDRSQLFIVNNARLIESLLCVLDLLLKKRASVLNLLQLPIDVLKLSGGCAEVITSLAYATSVVRQRQYDVSLRFGPVGR